jgi:hypothetical protein
MSCAQDKLGSCLSFAKHLYSTLAIPEHWAKVPPSFLRANLGHCLFSTSAVRQLLNLDVMLKYGCQVSSGRRTREMQLKADGLVVYEDGTMGAHMTLVPYKKRERES